MAKAHKDLLAELREAGLTEFGAVFPHQLVLDILDIEVPEVASKQAFDALTLVELQAITYCRDALLNEGKYLKREATGYRVLLPSENQKQCELLLGAADRKQFRALKLARNTPAEAMVGVAQIETRVYMKQQGFRPAPGALRN